MSQPSNHLGDTQSNTLSYAMEQLRLAGFEKTQCSLSSDYKQELNVENGVITLLRSGSDRELYLSGIIDQKKASLSINDLRNSSIDAAVAELLLMAKGSEADDAYTIAPAQPSGVFSTGPQQADLEAMYDSLTAFLTHLKQNHPNIVMTECSLDYTRIHSRMVNSNGIDFTETRGNYNGCLLFNAKSGHDITSLNSTGFTTFTLDKPFHQFGSIEQLLRSSEAELQAQLLPEKFTGDLIITPDAMDDFIGFLVGSVTDAPLIANISLYKDKLHETVTSPCLTLKSLPLDSTMPNGYPFTSDGFKADNLTLLNNGVLESFLLTDYGARKTGLKKAVNEGGCMVLEPGKQALTDIIASTQEGVILGHLSGGAPADKGDFSGIAKNSYYVKDGQIQFPLAETMVSGNMATILRSIVAVSKDVVDFGDSRYPWVKAAKVSFS
ncbi:TldD/PmbA family protein [Endozoicomonas euniceicola]|uniref:TldD/PmbA family protein n=1 Tax=Endozoicomonas euniceicola TaxID=1234143 RepID=A0ABY6GRK0_9GAMM|nr:TldD/PmbA family protein [Endozoicomonas euniceicola]UYM15366.1 TldD/PmbA family protein [Endozoicomonas euniceicola]